MPISRLNLAVTLPSWSCSKAVDCHNLATVDDDGPGAAVGAAAGTAAAAGCCCLSLLLDQRSLRFWICSAYFTGLTAAGL